VIASVHARDPGPRLLPGPAHFIVTEDPAYAPCGSGEHIFLHIEKEGLTTDAVAQALAKAFQLKNHSVGYAGRKDRHAITRQWFSLHTPSAEAGLAALPECLPPSGRCTILEVNKHKNKLRLGHLAGNRFQLGLAGITADEVTTRAMALQRDGLSNRFGAQRFGHGGATLALARAWAVSDFDHVARLVVDNDRGWQVGEPIPPGFRSGPEGKFVGALRRGLPAAKALRAGGETLRQLIASAAQSAVFNAIVDARIAHGLLHTPRVGELAAIRSGAFFAVTAEDHADVLRRAQPGCLEVVATAPLPGASCRHGSPESLAEEQAWSAATEVDWQWFDRGTPLESPGERRPVVVVLRDTPHVRAEADHVVLDLALPAGAYATEALQQMGIAIPQDRRG